MKDKETESANSDPSRVVAPEIGFIIVAVGISTIAIATGAGNPNIFVKAFSLLIFLMAIWGATILYWHLLFEKIPATMVSSSNKKKGSLSLKGPGWLFYHWIKLVPYAWIKIGMKNRDKSLEFGYITILMAMYAYWLAGMIIFLAGFLSFIQVYN